MRIIRSAVLNQYLGLLRLGYHLFLDCSMKDQQIPSFGRRWSCRGSTGTSKADYSDAEVVPKGVGHDIDHIQTLQSGQHKLSTWLYG